MNTTYVMQLKATPTVGDSVHGTSPSTSSVTESASVKFVHFPHKDFITFPQKIDREKAEGKLRELNLKNGETLNEAQGKESTDSMNAFLNYLQFSLR